MTPDLDQPTSRNTSSRLFLGFALTVPALLACIGTLLIPSISTFLTSLRASPGEDFVGLENYLDLFTDEAYIEAFGFTLLLLLVRLLVVALVPLILALLVNELGRRQRLVMRLLFTLPLALFAPFYYLMTWRLMLFHVSRALDFPFIADPDFSRPTLLLVESLGTLSLALAVGLIFYLMALRGPQAETTQRRHVVLPLIVTWIVGLLATAALTLQSFAPSQIFSAGLANTATLMFHQFRSSFLLLDLGFSGAAATVTLLLLASLGLIAVALLVFTRLQIQTVPLEKDSALFTPNNKTIALVLLVLLLLLVLPAILLAETPRLWAFFQSFGAAPDLPPPFEDVSLLRVYLNTLAPLFIGVVLIQLPLTYLAALGIGALRPFGKWSELMLLLFSPWLFVTPAPLSSVLLRWLVALDLTGSFLALIPPILVNVPMLLLLTLFFKGQAARQEAEQGESETANASIFQTYVVPSIPLALFLTLATILFYSQDLFWQMTIGGRPQNMTALVFILNAGMRVGVPEIALIGALALRLLLPTFLIYLLIFGLFQLRYLDRLALVRAGLSAQPDAADASPLETDNGDELQTPE